MTTDTAATPARWRTAVYLSSCPHEPAPTLGRMRLLVVEDEPKMAALLRRGLTEEGYAVDVTDGGAEAVWMATGQD